MVDENRPCLRAKRTQKDTRAASESMTDYDFLLRLPKSYTRCRCSVPYRRQSWLYSSLCYAMAISICLSVCLFVCLSVCRQRLLLLRTCWPQQYWDSRNMGAPHDIVSSSCNNLYPQWNLCWRRGLTHGTTLVERALSHKHTGKLPTSSVVWVFPCALVHGALNVCVL